MLAVLNFTLIPYYVYRARGCRPRTNHLPNLSNYVRLLESVLRLSDLAAHELAQPLLGGYALTNCRRYHGGHSRTRAEAYSNQGLRPTP